MTENREGLWHQITVHWGAATIVGVFGVAVAVLGGRALYVRSQPSQPPAADDSTRRALQNLEARVEAGQEESRKKDEQIASLLKEIQRLRQDNATNVVPAPVTGTVPSSTSQPSAVVSPQRIEKGDFTFELRGCDRRGDDVRCSLSVKNATDVRKSMNLCGASYLVDESGQKPQTRVTFSGGGCGSFHLEPGLPNALEMVASMPHAQKLNVVLSDGNWFSFSGTVIFKDVRIDGSP